jgi:hypothetical protein
MSSHLFGRSFKQSQVAENPLSASGLSPKGSPFGIGNILLKYLPLAAEATAFASHHGYVGNPRGAEWHKWDLHVHTPASVEQYYGDRVQEQTWNKYIDALAALPDEIRAIGVNDYFSIEGYRRIVEARASGRLSNLALILPVVELRILSFAGHAELKKLNFHVVFSDELTAEEIEQFFLHRLSVELQLDDGPPWRGCVGTEAGLVSLGQAVRAAAASGKRREESALRTGFSSAAVELYKIWEALDQSIFRGKYLTALGLSEWSQMRWDGAGAAQKRDAIQRVDFVFTASPSPVHYEERHTQLAWCQFPAPRRQRCSLLCHFRRAQPPRTDSFLDQGRRHLQGPQESLSALR